MLFGIPVNSKMLLDPDIAYFSYCATSILHHLWVAISLIANVENDGNVAGSGEKLMEFPR